MEQIYDSVLLGDMIFSKVYILVCSFIFRHTRSSAPQRPIKLWYAYVPNLKFEERQWKLVVRHPGCLLHNAGMLAASCLGLLGRGGAGCGSARRTPQRPRQAWADSGEYHEHFGDGADREHIHGDAHLHWGTCNQAQLWVAHAPRAVKTKP